MSAPGGKALGELFSEVRIAARRDEAAGQLRISLDAPPAMRAAHEVAGQFIELAVGESAERGYFALLNAPGEGDALELLVRKDATEGGQAAALLAAQPVGSSVFSSPPMGAGFLFERIRGRKVRVVATGTAIAPARAAIHYLGPSSTAVLSLDYGVRSDAHVALRDELQALRAAGIDVAVHVSRLQDGVLSGKLAHHALANRWGQDAPSHEVVIAVGQLEMVAEVRALWAARGGDPEDVLHNY